MPQIKPTENEHAEERGPREEYVRQVEDHSLPAQEVLADQQDGRPSSEAPLLFVP